MNTDILIGQWKQIKGEIKKQWGKLTDNDLDIAEGNRDKLVGLVQEKYGYGKDQAQREVDQFLKRYND